MITRVHTGRVRRVLLAGTVMGALLAMPGCISLLPEAEPNALYRLAPVPAITAQSPRDAQPIVIDRVAAPRGLSGDRVAIVQDGTLGYMAQAAWLSPAPVLVHNQIMDIFLVESPELIPARTEDGVNARYRLQLELRRFEAVYDQGAQSAPTVHVRLQARLIDRDTRQLIGLRQIHEDVRARENRQSAIIDAFSQGTNAAVRELANWTLAEVNEGADAPS